MDKDIAQFKADLLARLPAIVTRKQALAATGNIFSPRTLSNMESRNEGPKNKMKFGRQVAYRREDFVEFIVSKLRPS